MADKAPVDAADVDMERHLKRTIDEDDNDIESKKTKAGDKGRPSITITEAETSRDAQSNSSVLDAISRLQIAPIGRDESTKELMMKLRAGLIPEKK